MALRDSRIRVTSQDSKFDCPMSFQKLGGRVIISIRSRHSFEGRELRRPSTPVLIADLLVSAAVVHLGEPLATQSAGVFLQSQVDRFEVSFKVGALARSAELLTATPARDAVFTANWGRGYL